MGIFSYRPSTVEFLDDGRLRFTPEPPDPRWMRVMESLTWPVVIAVFAIAWVGEDDPGALLIVASVFLGLSLLFVVYAKVARWRSGEVRVDPPTEPVTLDADLAAKLRDLAATDHEVDAIRLVRERLGVGLTDGARIVRAARDA